MLHKMKYLDKGLKIIPCFNIQENRLFRGDRFHNLPLFKINGMSQIYNFLNELKKYRFLSW